MATLVANRAASPHQPEEKRQHHRTERSRGSKRAGGERVESAAALQPAAAHEYQCGRKAIKPIASKMAKKSGTDKL